MKKVLLLSANQAKIPYPVPPLGLALLHSILKDHYEVRLLDGLDLDAPQLHSLLLEFQPDYVGLSIRNIDDMVKGEAHSFLPAVLEKFVTPVKQYQKAILILGGSGFTIFPRELMDFFEADYGVAGEGEESFLELLQAIDGGTDIASIDGVLQRGGRYSKRKVPVKGYSQRFRADLDLLLDYEPYRLRGAYPVQTKRGCAHRCIYCSYPVLEGRLFRVRNVHDVVDEIEQTAERIQDSSLVFEFVDSTFNDPPGHAEKICTEIIRRGLSVTLRTMGMNPANITRELLHLMLQAGFAQIDATPDSGSPVMLRNYRKNFSYEQLLQAAMLVRECDMPTMWFFIFGGPGETEKTLAESFAFIDEYVSPNDMVNITEGLRIYPQTRLVELAVRENIITADQSLLFPTFYVSADFREDTLSERIDQMIAVRPNCLRITDTKPPPALLQAALAERREKDLKEPMFRTLLRLKGQFAA